MCDRVVGGGGDRLTGGMKVAGEVSPLFNAVFLVILEGGDG